MTDRHDKQGFTLVEIMVTLAIVAILVVAALTVTVRMSRIAQTAAGVGQTDRRQDYLRQVLEIDLAHAERFGRLSAGPGFLIVTRACLEPQALELAHLPTTVTYRVVNVGQSHCLIRTQQFAARQPMRELVCRGVRDLFLAAEAEQPTPAGQTRPVPETVNVVVDFGGPQDLALYSFRTR